VRRSEALYRQWTPGVYHNSWLLAAYVQSQDRVERLENYANVQPSKRVEYVNSLLG